MDWDRIEGNWKQLTGNGLPGDVKGRIALEVARSNPNVVYAQIEVQNLPATLAQGGRGGGGGGGGGRGGGAPANLATKTLIPIKIEEMNTITTIQICVATPMAALPSNPTRCPTMT